jgi:hypothetical protein
MRQFYLPILFILITLAYSCSTPGKRNIVQVYPLSPYLDSVTFSKDEDVSSERKSGIKIKYFIIDENMEYSELSKSRLQDFIRDSLKREYTEYKAVYFTFYKPSSSLDKDFKQTAANKLTNHNNDKFAEFEYINGKLFNFVFYKECAYY